MGSRLDNKSAQTRKRIEGHTFDNEDGDEYGGSKFGGFPEYFRRKKIKLQNLDAELRAKSDKPPIFRGIVVHVNGYTQPSLNDLHTLIVNYGGGFVQYLDGKTMVTHIIASNLTPKKAVEFKRYRIVKPAWIVDSISAGKLLPWDGYRVIDEGVGQRVLAFDGGQVISQVNKQTKGYRDQSDTSWYTSQVKGVKDKIDGPSSSRPSFSRGQLESSTPAFTPELDDIQDSDFEGLDDDQGEGRDDDQGEDLAQGQDKTTEPYIGRQIEPQPNPEALPQTPPHTSPLDQLEPGSAAAPEITSPYGPAKSVSQGLKRTRSTRSPSPRKAAKLTAEEHNAILLADPRLRKSTVLNPDFLEQYYRESRLHHLSTWKADLKTQLQALTAEKSSSQRSRQKRPVGSRRYVLHVDFDSFFAAISLKKFPQYKDVPAVVAHGPGSGSEIASCNYPARRFGISNGMWMKRAQDLVADLKVLPYDFPAYEEASRKFYDAILDTEGVVQSVSIDEALIDVSHQCIAYGGTDGIKRFEGSVNREQTKADEIAQGLRDKVLELTGCNVSVGIGGNILLAKIALRKAKPAGQYQLKPEEVLDFVGRLEVQSLPGVAYSIGGKLEEIGIKFVKDIRECSREKLLSTLGPKTGEKLWEYARGIDKTEVGEQVVRKSVSAEVNWGVRFENQEQVDEFMQSLCLELQKRLIKENVKGRQLTVKVMRRSPTAPLDPPKHLGHGLCDTYNKSLQLGVATNDSTLLTKEVLAIMRGFGFSPGELRGLGVQMTKLEPLKPGGPDGSQQRLRFKTAQPSKTGAKVVDETSEDPIADDIETPKKNRVRDVKQAGIPEGILNSYSPSKRPLNMLGTQFALPTQVDPKVLAELPEEIRAKLTRQPRSKAVPDHKDDGRRSPTPATTKAKPRPTTRGSIPATVALPNQSQLDPEILNSLPEDVRRDVLAMYQTSELSLSPRKNRDQTLLPQSPRKNRTIPTVQKVIPARKSRGGGGLFSRFKTNNNTPTLTQANFVARTTTDTDSEDPTTSAFSAADEEIDQDFLAALPPSLRQELLASRRSAQLRKTGGIEYNKRGGNNSGSRRQEQQNTIEKMFRLPPRRERPRFTSKGLTEIGELRDSVGEWVREFRGEVPYKEDVEALATYLGDVVEIERDLGKASKVVKWLDLCVGKHVFAKEEAGGGTDSEVDEVRGGWRNAVERVKQAVQDAVKARGMPEVDFG